MHYRAFIVAILSVSHLQLPFDSPETLLQSEYRLLVRPGGAYADRFSKAGADTIKGQLYTHKVDKNNSVKSVKKNLAVLLKDEAAAFMYLAGNIESYDEFKCKVVLLAIYSFSSIIPNL